MMSRDEQSRLFTIYLERMAATRQTKNTDYANDADSLANFRLSETAGIPAWVGLLMRLGDKFARASEVARKVINGQEPSFAVTSEGFEDIILDGANYFLLMGIAFQEWQQKRMQEGALEITNYPKSGNPYPTPGGVPRGLTVPYKNPERL